MSRLRLGREAAACRRQSTWEGGEVHPALSASAVDSSVALPSRPLTLPVIFAIPAAVVSSVVL